MNVILQVDKLRIQASEQAEVIATQEKEVMSKKEQLEGLKMEEQRLEEQKNENLRKLEQLTTNLQDTQLNISQVIIIYLFEQSVGILIDFFKDQGAHNSTARANEANE